MLPTHYFFAPLAPMSPWVVSYLGSGTESVTSKRSGVNVQSQVQVTGSGDFSYQVPRVHIQLQYRVSQRVTSWAPLHSGPRPVDIAAGDRVRSIIGVLFVSQVSYCTRTLAGH